MAAADGDDVLEDPIPPEQDAGAAKTIADRIAARDHDWVVPGSPVRFDGFGWSPHLVANDPPRVLHVHLSQALPGYIVRRLQAASATHRVHVALPLESLYDKDVLLVLSALDASVLVVDETGESTNSLHFLAAIADHSVPVDPELRRHLGRACWDRRRDGTNFEKGRRLEALLAFLLSQIGDFKVFERNFNSVTDEIDIVLQVDNFSKQCWSEPGVPFVLVEAKNWDEKTVGSGVVTLLIRKLETRRGRARIGLLFTTSSFSGEARDEELKEAKGNLCVPMLGPNEIEAWIEAEDHEEFLAHHVGKAMLR